MEQSTCLERKEVDKHKAPVAMGRTAHSGGTEPGWHLGGLTDRKSTRLNSSHRCISYAVFCLKKKKEAVDVRRVAGTHLERAVDIGKAVGVAIDEAIDWQVLLVGQEADKAPGRAGRNPAHLDDNAPCRFPKSMIIEALKHATGFNGEHETCIGPEAQMFDRARNAIGPTPQVGAVDLDGLFRRGIFVDNGEPTSD